MNTQTNIKQLIGIFSDFSFSARLNPALTFMSCSSFQLIPQQK